MYVLEYVQVLKIAQKPDRHCFCILELKMRKKKGRCLNLNNRNLDNCSDKCNEKFSSAKE